MGVNAVAGAGIRPAGGDAVEPCGGLQPVVDKSTGVPTDTGGMAVVAVNVASSVGRVDMHAPCTGWRVVARMACVDACRGVEAGMVRDQRPGV